MHIEQNLTNGAACDREFSFRNAATERLAMLQWMTPHSLTHAALSGLGGFINRAHEVRLGWGAVEGGIGERTESG